MNGSIPEGWEQVGKMKVMKKEKWMEYKNRLQELKKRMRIDSPEREFVVIAKELPIMITQTQIKDMLDIKPWRVDFKAGNDYARLIYVNQLDKKAILRAQPSLLGKNVKYLDVRS